MPECGRRNFWQRVNVIWQRVFGNSLVRQGEYSCDSLKLLATTQHVPTGSLLLPAVDSLFHLLSSGSYLGCDTENQMYLGAHACEHKTEIAPLLTTLGCLYRGDAVVCTFERSPRSQLKPAPSGHRFRRPLKAPAKENAPTRNRMYGAFIVAPIRDGITVDKSRIKARFSPSI